MTEKRFIQVWLDLKNQNGCWNCKNDMSICQINNIGTVGYIRGISHCALKDWEIDIDKFKNSKLNYSWFRQYHTLLGENEQLKQQIQQQEIENKELKQSVSDWSGSYDDLYEDLKRVEKENEQLKQQLNNFEVNFTQNFIEHNKDKLYVKDTHTRIDLKNGMMWITIFIPQTKEILKFKYRVSKQDVMKEYLKLKELEE